MTADMGPFWFVVRTKQHKELLTYNEFSRQAVEAFLPLIRIPLPVYGRRALIQAPLFPCYLFAHVRSDALFKVRSTRGVRDIVSLGSEPTAIQDEVVDDLKERCVDGVVDLALERFLPNEPVKVRGGIFGGWDAIFQRELSGHDRVAILLGNLETAGVRVVLPASSITRR